jgi:hypothetical protein
MFSCAFCAIIAAVGWSSSMNRCWKTCLTIQNLKSFIFLLYSTPVICRLYSCHINVILLSYICHTPVVYLSYSCLIYVILLSYICHTPVLYMSYSCRIYVIFMSYICHTPVIFLPYSRLPMTLCCCACAGQGLDGAPSLDVMLLKQQAFTADGSSQGNVALRLAALQYPYCRNHPLLQFLPLKLAEWIANNLADELRMRPASVDGWSSAQLNHILTSCLVSDRRGNNLHTFHTVEFEESDLYLAILLATPHQLFHTSMLDDNNRPSNSGVQTAKALHHAGAAMY